MNPVELIEKQRRIDAAIANASVAHMSNAKWRKLFNFLSSSGIGQIKWKFIHDDKIWWSYSPPSESELFADRIGDFVPCHGTPYREIEWIEFSVEHRESFLAQLSALGQFPIQQCGFGVRVIGYTLK